MGSIINLRDFQLSMRSIRLDCLTWVLAKLGFTHPEPTHNSTHPKVSRVFYHPRNHVALILVCHSPWIKAPPIHTQIPGIVVVVMIIGPSVRVVSWVKWLKIKQRRHEQPLTDSKRVKHQTNNRA